MTGALFNLTNTSTLTANCSLQSDSFATGLAPFSHPTGSRPPLQSPTLLCGEVPGCVPPPSQQAPPVQHLHHASHPCSSPTRVRRSTRVRRPTCVRSSSKRAHPSSCDSEDENCDSAAASLHISWGLDPLNHGSQMSGDSHVVPVLKSSSTKGFCDMIGCTNRLEPKYRRASQRLKLCSDHLEV